MYFWISTDSFIAFYKRGVKNLFLKYLVSQLGQISRSEKNKVISIEHLKQNLSLENN